MSRELLLALLAVTALALALAACSEDDGEDPGEEPSVSIIRPEDGATTGSTVSAEVELENFRLDPEGLGRANAEGSGHLHFSLDGGRFDDPTHAGPPGTLAFKLGTDGEYSVAVSPTITYSGLPPGEHTLRVELAQNDHSELGPSEQIDFSVE